MKCENDYSFFFKLQVENLIWLVRKGRQENIKKNTLNFCMLLQTLTSDDGAQKDSKRSRQQEHNLGGTPKVSHSYGVSILCLQMNQMVNNYAFE